MLLALLAACGGTKEAATPANNAAAPVAVETIEDPDSRALDGNDSDVVAADGWIGRWTGPEGLFLDIQPATDGKSGAYILTNRDTLDREADYRGVAQGEGIRFRRDGKDLTIRAGTGAETGFKWLADKQDCLIVQPGKEGYCR